MRTRTSAVALLMALGVLGAAALLPRPASATFPGPVGRIAYQGYSHPPFPNAGNSPAICAVVPGSTPGAVLHDLLGSDAYEYVWSPDSSTLAFTAEGTAGNYSFAIGVVGADGSGYHLLTSPGEGLASGPGFSPDGQRIAFAWNPSGYGALAYSVLAVMNADGTGKQTLGGERVHGGVQWSPDGTQLAFHQAFGEDIVGDVIVVSAADGSGRLVAAPRARDPDWRPGGGQLVVADGAGLSTVNADGTMRTHIPGSEEGDSEPVWSPDGGFIAFAHWVTVGGIPLGREIDAIRPDGSGRHVVVPQPEMSAKFFGGVGLAWGSAPAAAAGSPTCEAATGSQTPGEGEQTSDSTKPRLSVPALSPRRFRAAGTGARSATRVGTRVSYTLSEDATVRFRVERGLPGRRAGGRCRALKRSDRRPTNCTHYKALRGGFNQRGNEGPNALKFAGRLNGREITTGRYYLRGVATDHAGNESQAKRSRRFQLVRR